MATLTKFEDLGIWQEARQLSKEVYELTNRIPFTHDFSLKDQIRRSSGSLMDNIAEGFDRSGNKEFIQFLSIANPDSYRDSGRSKVAIISSSGPTLHFTR